MVLTADGSCSLSSGCVRSVLGTDVVSVVVGAIVLDGGRVLKSSVVVVVLVVVEVVAVVVVVDDCEMGSALPANPTIS